MKVMNTGKDTEITPAIGILAVLVENLDQCRQVSAFAVADPLT